MTPEDIEYVRQWVASGHEPRDADRVPSAVRYRCCSPGRIGGEPYWELSESGLTIASQAERIRELESFRFNVALETGVMHEADGHAPQPGPDESILAEVTLGRAARGREAEFAYEKHVASERIRELETENADLKAAFEQACEVAEACLVHVELGYVHQWEHIYGCIDVMRANRDRLLK